MTEAIQLARLVLAPEGERLVQVHLLRAVAERVLGDAHGPARAAQDAGEGAGRAAHRVVGAEADVERPRRERRELGRRVASPPDIAPNPSASIPPRSASAAAKYAPDDEPATYTRENEAPVISSSFLRFSANTATSAAACSSYARSPVGQPRQLA